MPRPLSERHRPPVVLLADDDCDHAFLAREAFAEAGLRIDFHHVVAGDDCLAFLRRQGEHGSAPRPDLLLLDIRMPRMDGCEVLQQIRADPALQSLVVIAMSTSAEESDVIRMHDLGCNSYLCKPVDFGAFTATVAKLAAYWFDLVVLPSPAAC